MKPGTQTWFARLAVMLIACLSLWAQQAPPPADYFRQSCANCHTVGGGRLTGPDLKGVSERKDREWLVRFLQNPKAMIDSGDAYAVKLQQEARGVLMPVAPSMDPARARALLDLIEAESKLPRSQFAGAQISDRPLTEQDVANGRQIFLGTQRLASGGASCMSCHTVKGLGGLGGGRLGPDLTLVYERLQGRKGLGAWMMSPASPTMGPVFKTKPLQPDEILVLIAFFEDSARKGGQDNSAAPLNFFLLGLGVMVLGMVSLDAIWKNRLRSVRRELVSKKERGEE